MDASLCQTTEALCSDICICCKLPKTGAFFYKPSPDSGKFRFYEFKKWRSHVDIFAQATREGCRRCALVLDMVTSWSRGGLPENKHYVEVSNVDYDQANRRAGLGEVGVALYSQESDSFGGTLLRLLTPNCVNAELTCREDVEPNCKPNCKPKIMVGDWILLAQPFSFEDALSEYSLKHFEYWLDTCTKTHRTCASAPSTMPKRILHLTQSIVKVEQLSTESTLEHYACLSHCWGPVGPSMKLTAETEAALQHGICLSDMPKTFSDAARVCLALGVRYLWIDALCIKQEDAADWKEAAANMADIYARALFTIAAACGNDSDDGLRPLSPRFKKTKLQHFEVYVREYIPCECTEEVLPAGLWPLLSRAWVFQEMRLSQRVIYFSCYQTVWRCRTAQRSENGCHDRDWSAGSYEMSCFGEHNALLDPTGKWNQVVRNYSSLKLTFPSDRLPAIAAVAQRMSAIRKGDVYIAGMWKKTMLHDMRWQVRHAGVRPANGLPSWSWAFTQGIVHTSSSYERFPSSAEIMGIDYTTEGPPHVGLVKDATMRIRGPHLSLTRYPCEHDMTCSSGCINHFRVASSSLSSNETRVHLDFQPIGENPPRIVDVVESNTRYVNLSDEHWAADSQDPLQKHTYTVLLLSRTVSLAGLVLCRVGNQYQRIGWMALYPKQDPTFDDDDSDIEDHTGWFDEQISRLPVSIFEIL